MAKRTKQVDNMVDAFNNYLNANHIIDDYNETFMVFSATMISANVYKGYNWFYDMPYTDAAGKVTTIPRLCKTNDKEKLSELKAYLQLY